MSKEILKCPRAILISKYDKPIDKKLIPKGAKLLSELNEKQSAKIIRLFDYFLKNGIFKGTKRDLFLICEPNREPEKWEIVRNYETIKQISKMDFVLPYREKGEKVIITNTRQIFILEEFRKLEGDLEGVEDLRIRSIHQITPHDGTLEFFRQSTADKNTYDYVKIEKAGLIGLKNKQIDFANRIFNYISYEISNNKAHTRSGDIKIDIAILADRINASKTFKKDKKRFCVRLKIALESIEKANNIIKRIVLDETSGNTIIEY